MYRAACAPGWYKWQTHCFGISQYPVNKTLYSRNYCQSMGADLPTVANDAIDGFLYYLFSRTSLMTVCSVRYVRTSSSSSAFNIQLAKRNVYNGK